MDIALWFGFVTASTALLLVPGPTVLLVLSYAIGQGRRVAVATALGVAFGDLIAMTAALAGLGAVLATSATAFTLLKWAGAAYLVWLGWRLIRSAGAPATAGRSSAAAAAAETSSGPSAVSVFRHAALVTALNPKSIGFFVAFVPHFIRPDAPLLPQASLLVATFVGLAALNALAYALLADRLRLRLARPGVTLWLTRCGGLTLIGMGAATALLRRPA